MLILRTFWSGRMPFLSSQKAVLTKKRGEIMQQDTKIMLKLAEILLQNQLISPEEKYYVTRFIRRDDDV